jgi:XTP/dITP diphosphohydrolase
MKIILSSHNPSKIHQIKSLLNNPKITLLTLEEAGIPGEAVEDGETLEENSLKKALYAYEALQEKGWVMSEDTGFFIEALNGEPGIKAARWLGENLPTIDTTNYCLKRMSGEANRKAKFMTVATLIAPDGTQHFFTGEVEGTILLAPRCEPQPKMPYSPLFVPNGFDKSWAEMDVHEENKISHRGKAFRKVVEFLNKTN